MTQPPPAEPAPCNNTPHGQFCCNHCEEPTPLDDLQRARVNGPLGPVTLDLCPACYREGMDDGILESWPPNEPGGAPRPPPLVPATGGYLVSRPGPLTEPSLPEAVIVCARPLAPARGQSDR